MERINRMSVKTRPGEVLDFEPVYGLKFGDPARKVQTFGVRGFSDENQGAICVQFIVPTHSETLVGFTAGISNMQMLAGKRRLTISTAPYGEGDVIRTINYPWGGDLTGFVSADGTDPLGERTRRVFDHDGKLVSEKAPARMWLKPGGTYYVTLRRTDRDTGKLFPLSLMYIGTDDPARGGEVAIILPADLPSEGAIGIPMTFGALKGIFLPED